MKGKVVLFGAGATGRGHVGFLAWQAGYELVLVDQDAGLVRTLREAGEYRVRLFGSDGRPEAYREMTVRGFRAFEHSERAAIAAEIAGADLVLTAVFDQNLLDVAQTLALAVQACQDAGRTRPLNCVACENMINSSSTLGWHVLGRLDGAAAAYCQQVFGFPDCMISRVVPRPEPDPLLILTEDYNEWTVRAADWKGERLAGLPALELVDNQTARLERKLFIHNGGHAVCGYFGYYRGCRYISDAVADPVVAQFVTGALDELGAVIQRKYHFSAAEIDEYKADLARRGSIAALKDEVLRVVRDPIRKLSPHERLVAPALLAVEYGLPRVWIVQGIAAALRYRHPADTQSLRLGEMLASAGIEGVLEQVCGLPPASPLFAEILQAWRDWDQTMEGLL